MKFNKWTLGLDGLIVACAMVASTAMAQEFPAQTTRTLVLSPMQTMSGSTFASVTNGPQDKLGAVGQGFIDICASTNASGNTETAQIYTSPDQTNLTALANYGLINSTTSLTVTNFLYGGTNGLTAANLYLLPGTITTPTASTSGWATPYVAEIPFTNSGAITISKGTYRVIINNMQDANRYFYIVYSASGTATNLAVGANLTFPIMRQ